MEISVVREQRNVRVKNPANVKTHKFYYFVQTRKFIEKILCCELSQTDYL